MSLARKAKKVLNCVSDYASGVDMIRSANRHAAAVAEFELDKDQIHKARSGFQKHTLVAFVVNQAVNFAQVLNLGSMVASAYDSFVNTRKPYDELVVATTPYIVCATVLEAIRFMSRKSVSLKEKSEHESYRLRLYMRDPEEQRELERLYADWEKDWKESKDK